MNRAVAATSVREDTPMKPIWKWTAPTVLLLGVSTGLAMRPATPTSSAPLHPHGPALRRLQTELGRKIYTVGWAPIGTRLGESGIKRGARRILQPFATAQGATCFILSQEPRNPSRDAYHRKLFIDRAGARVDLDGKTGYLVDGASGERRLFWNEKDTALIVSSVILSDDELIRIALGVR